MPRRGEVLQCAYRCVRVPGVLLGVLLLPAAGLLHGGDTECGTIGPDLLVGEIHCTEYWGQVGDIHAWSICTDVCNIGDEILDWVADTNQHPVIAQHMYRLADGRFEQIGQSWVKHGWGAAQNNTCDCGCTPGDWQHLGVGCSDGYSASGNGQQATLGPKWQVNGFTGHFPYPHEGYGQSGNAIFKRIQVQHEDVDAGRNQDSAYFVEGHYVHPDDGSLLNGYNNASWREVGVDPDSFELTFLTETARGVPAIMAWAQREPGVNIRAIDLPMDGRLYLAWTARVGRSSLAWEYEFALYNLNSDRGVGAFKVLVAGEVPGQDTILEHGFHDVAYHSGDAVDSTDWYVAISPGSITWSTTQWEENEFANALRWGTLYNYRFTSPRPPEEVQFVELEFFKPGFPDMITVPLVPDPPSNDTCADAVPILSGTTIVNTIGAATGGPQEPCGDILTDVWYRYTVPCSTGVVFELCSETFTSRLAVYDDSCPGDLPDALACLEGDCSGSRITIPALAGETLLVRVGSSSAETGTVSLSIMCGGPLVNDDCDEAILIEDGLHLFSTIEATTDGPAHPGLCDTGGDGGQTYNDIWYLYTAPSDDTLVVSTCHDVHGAGHPDYDTDLVLYGPYESPGAIDCENLLFLDCNDDDPTHPCGGDPIWSSHLEVTVQKGSTYLVRVGGWNADSRGSGTLFLDGTSDSCSGDIDGDGMVSFLDLLEVLSMWGPCPACNADIDGDGSIGFQDLLQILSAWGQCAG